MMATTGSSISPITYFFSFIISLDKFTNKLGLSSTLKPITDSNEDVPMNGTRVPEEEVCLYFNTKKFVKTIEIHKFSIFLDVTI